MNKPKTVAITGAGGFIGSHLVENLVIKGWKVKALVHYNSRNNWGNLERINGDILDDAEIVFGDILDPGFMKTFLKGVDVVFHLAALISIPFSYQAPLLYFRVNVEGTINVLQACLENSVEKIVVTSTSEVYGTAQYTPIDEAHPLQAQSPYSASKIGAEKSAQSYYCAFDLPVAVIRLFNTFGPRQSSRAIIPTIITQALVGNEIKLGNTTPVRDMTYVLDAVDGFIKIAECDESVGEVINIGCGIGYSIKEIVEVVGIVLDKEFRIIKDEKRMRPEKSEVLKLVCSNRKAFQLLQWIPNYYFQRELRLTIESIQEDLDLYKPGRYNI
ncbi:MAG TPA: NAD-dependent epimerase/dehydratase family protein [bacterium]|nr:NAD-dependent epimerase/dehydratase family protein [bacterium]